jgi:hypothetical protein
MTGLLLICLLASNVGVQPPQERQADHSAAINQKQTNRKPEPSNTVPSAKTTSIQKAVDDHTLLDQKTWDWHDAIAPQTWSNWLLGLVGIGGIIAAVYTLLSINRQASILERQTKATEESVKTLTASERAWLTASLMRDATKKDGQWYWSDRPEVRLTTEEVTKGLQYKYKLRVTNIGKTPAQILGYEQCYSCLGKDGITARSRSSSYIIGSENQERTMKAGDSADIFTLKIDVPMHLHLKKIDSLEETAIFYGWVKYRPVIDQSEDCFADFCYAWKPSLEILYRRDDCNPEKHDKN